MENNTKVERTLNKLYLIAYNPKKRPVREKKEATISINNKYGRIMISERTIIELGMENKFMRVYYDSGHNVVAWKVKDSVSLEEMKQGWKQVKISKNRMFFLGIKSILQTMNLKNDKYHRLVVKKYKDYGMIDSDDYYYVNLK